MKYYIISGEASGDLHASNLVTEIRKLDNAFVARGWGGDLMEAQGVSIVKHYRDLAFMGFLEVVANLRTILKNIDFCKKDILGFKPDCIILVDYPGFNLRIASFAKKAGIKVFYYISPQVWAWKESRVHNIIRDVDRMMVILPFEKEFYRKYHYDVDFVGHPLLDAISKRNKAPSGNWLVKQHLQGQKIIALLPGSRKQEISVMLPIMLSVIDEFKNYTFVIAGAPSIETGFYLKWISKSNVKVVQGETYNLLENASAALVTSGTATLETALFNVPEVVCYKGNFISYQIAKKLVKVKYISLVNLIMDQEVVPELIQSELNRDSIIGKLSNLLNESPERKKMLDDYILLREKLGGEGASARTAGIIVNALNLSRVELI